MLIYIDKYIIFLTTYQKLSLHNALNACNKFYKMTVSIYYLSTVVLEQRLAAYAGHAIVLKRAVGSSANP